MLQLPVELQRHCIHFVQDISTLRSLRLVSKASAAVATEALFQTVKLFPAEDSARRYTNIIKDADLNALVKRVVFHSSFDNQLMFGDDIEWEWHKALKRLLNFQNVNEAQLIFAQECALSNNVKLSFLWGKSFVQPKSFRINTLIAFFKSVAKAKDIDSLTIKNLQFFEIGSVYEVQAFQDVRGRLKKLHLLGAMESRPDHESAGFLEHCNVYYRNDFFASTFFDNWLTPVQSQLTHLTLYMMDYWGVYPFCDLRSVFFPNLVSLAFGKYTIAHDWQIDWIISHAARLESLILDGCPIVIAACMEKHQYERNWTVSDFCRHDGYRANPVYTNYIDLRWARVFDRFRDGLPKLSHFAIGHGDWLEQTMFEERYALLPRLESHLYAAFDCGNKTSLWIEGRRQNSDNFMDGKMTLEWPGYDEDEQALTQLIRIVYERAMMSGYGHSVPLRKGRWLLGPLPLLSWGRFMFPRNFPLPRPRYTVSPWM
jgi:hypothetical protein